MALNPDFTVPLIATYPQLVQRVGPQRFTPSSSTNYDGKPLAFGRVIHRSDVMAIKGTVTGTLLRKYGTHPCR